MTHEVSYKPLGPKEEGEHRFIVFASFLISKEMAIKAINAEESVILDHENIHDINIGCIDCEHPLDKFLPLHCDAEEYKP